MADWNGMARSNYFRVKDEAAFRKWAEYLELAVITDSEGRFGVYSKTDDGGFPSERLSEDVEEMEDLDFPDELAAHLVEGSIAILMTAGHEKDRYVSGYAIALNSEGKRVELVLSDIYTKAAELFQIDISNITQATY
jgi:hypothetical protein